MHFEKSKQTYCFHPFNSFSCSSAGRVRACCAVDESKFRPENITEQIVNHDNLSSAINAPHLKRVRAMMLRGERPEECNGCWTAEKNGIKSIRQIFNEMYPDRIESSLARVDAEGTIQSDSITHLDLTLGSLCNLKCRSCNPWSSSKWIDEAPLIPHVPWDERTFASSRTIAANPWFEAKLTNGFFDAVIPNLRQVNFLGGEPTLVKQHQEWLQSVVDKGFAPNIVLSYNTNATYLPKYLLDTWRKFKSIQLSISLDATGPLAHYVRHPSDFSTIEANLKELARICKEMKNIHVQTHVTLSVLNIHDIRRTLYWCRDQYRSWSFRESDGRNIWHYGYQNLIPHFNIVSNPSYLHMRLAPEHIKVFVRKELLALYEELSDEPVNDWEKGDTAKLRGLLEYLDMPQDPVLWEHFLTNTKVSDAHRGIDIRDYIPWMEPYLTASNAHANPQASL